MTVTHIPLAKYTMPTSGTTVTFSNIPQTPYNHLVIGVTGVAGSGSGYVFMRLNGDAGTNYWWSAGFNRWNGSSHNISGGGGTAYNAIGLTPTESSINFGAEIEIMDFTKTDRFKVVVGNAGYVSTTAGQTTLVQGTWQNTNAVNSVTIQTTTSMEAGTVISIVGIH